MRRLSRTDFTKEFPLVVPAWNITGIEHNRLEIDREAQVSGILESDLVIRTGARVLLTGIVGGSVTVEKDAVLYHTGIIKGNLNVSGAACVSGIIGRLQTDNDATIALEGLVEKETIRD